MPVRAESFAGTGRTFQFVACSSLESEPRCFGGCLLVPCGVTASVGQSFSAMFRARAAVKSHDATWDSVSQRYLQYHMNMILN